MKRQYYTPHSRIVPKILYYNSDGTGRDSYINVNSGGICRVGGVRSNLGDRRDLIFSNLKKKMDFGIPPKVVHYSSDGTGRDNYIVINEGGLTFNDLKDYQFINSLRGYKKINKIDFFEQTQKVLPFIEQEKKKKKFTLSKNS